ncbi:MAG: sigma-70 family RNA polymerase sigma factor [bacterium]
MVEPSASSSDEDLAQQARRGDHAAFAALVKKHADRFYRVAYRLLRNAGEAEDVVQQAYLKFWQDPGKFDPGKNTRWSTWFYRVIVNACLDRLKRGGRESAPAELDLSADPAPGADTELAARQQSQALSKALAALPERQRTALTLCFWEGLSNQEAADLMGLRLKALQSLLVRAKENLRAALRPEWGLKAS